MKRCHRHKTAACIQTVISCIMNLTELDQFSEGLCVGNLLLEFEKTIGKWYTITREILDRWSVSEPVGFWDVERLVKEIVPDLTCKLSELKKKKKQFLAQCKSTQEALNTTPSPLQQQQQSTLTWMNPEPPQEPSKERKLKRKRPEKKSKLEVLNSGTTSNLTALEQEVDRLVSSSTSTS